jgi:integral membrane protein (TIGR01906 family)
MSAAARVERLRAEIRGLADHTRFVRGVLAEPPFASGVRNVRELVDSSGFGRDVSAGGGRGSRPQPGYHAWVTAIEPDRSWRGAVATVLVGIATAVVIVSIAILPFLSSPWLAFEQGRAESAAWTGFSEADVARVTNAIVADMLVETGSFDQEVAGEPVLNERERGHMRDVQTVFRGLWFLAGASLIVLGVAALVDRARFWHGVRRGAAVLAVGVVLLGVVALVAFDALFETFHRLFFAGGSYTFDASTERLVQLFPFQFWQETAMAVGALIVVLSAVLWWIAGNRERAAVSRAALAAGHPNPAPEGA